MPPKPLHELVEYYPRHKRAPYLYNISSFGLHSSGDREGDGGWDVNHEDGDDGMGDDIGFSAANVPNRAPSKSTSLSNLSSPAMRRGSSFARALLGMSTGTIVEDENSSTVGYGDVLVADEGGGGRDLLLRQPGDSDTGPNSLPATRFRMGSSSDFSSQQRNVSTGDNPSTRIPRWALHDQNATVIKDGHPIQVDALLHHHFLHRRSLKHPANFPHYDIVTPTWRLKERMKTVGVCLVLALNIGTDPPDLNKPTPCAKLQCWLDPTTISRAKAKERIGERLEQQYAKWQQRSKLKYRRAIDPTVDAVKELCIRMRESAKNERVLLHYNGHGVPRPTANGEIWLFDNHHTNYIPLSVTDLRRWIGKPSVIVLDCSSAGVLMPFLTSPLNDAPSSSGGSNGFFRSGSNNSYDQQSDGSSYEYLKAIRDTIVLCPTAQGEWLPLDPEFPADIFTSCLTTPIPTALRWFVHQTPMSTHGLDLDNAIPGKLTDRRTPLGELNWIFTAITDTIAWNVLPSPLFQRLFRQDLLVASMFRNFLLADRILRSLNCTPMSHPELPSTCNHPLWQAWDLAVETCLTQLMDSGYLKKLDRVAQEPTAGANEGMESALNAGDSTTRMIPQQHQLHTPFFAEQLTAFEIWLELASAKAQSKLTIMCPPRAAGGMPLPFLEGREDARWGFHELDPPQELPIVLQVLLSQAHRVRALVLLRRFLDLGPSAVNLALSVGIFPYVLKLLQSPIDEYKHVLIDIWARVLGFDHSCQEDVVKDRALPHFIRHLRWGLSSSPSYQQQAAISNEHDASKQRTMSAFILSIICSGYSHGQSECINEKLHCACENLLRSLESPDQHEQKEAEIKLTPHFRTWLLICVGNLSRENATAQCELYKSAVHFRLLARLDDDTSDVRAASCYALGSLIGNASSVLQKQLQPQLQTPAPQALSPIMSGALPSPSTSELEEPSLGPSAASQASFLQPQPATAGKQPMIFGNILSAQPSLHTPPQQHEGIKSVYEDEQRTDLDLSVALKLAEVTADPSVVVRFEAVLALNGFIRKYIHAYVSIVGGKTFGEKNHGRSVLGGSVPTTTIPMPFGVGNDAGKKLAEIWAAVVKLHRSDPFQPIRELVDSIMTEVNKHVVAEISRLRQLRGRRSLTGSMEEKGLYLSSPPKPASDGFPSAPQTAPSKILGPRKGPVENSFRLESSFFVWKKFQFAEQTHYSSLDPLSNKGAMTKYRMMRNSAMQHRGHLLKQSFAVLAERSSMSSVSQSSCTNVESDAAAGLEREADMKKQALYLHQVALFKNSGGRSTSLLRFHPYEPALVVCGNSDNISVWNAESSERMVTFSNGNPKNTRMTSALWINESSTSLLLTGSSDGTVRIFDGIFKPNDEIGTEKPFEVSSFVAAPDIVTDKRYSSGLVLEFQQCGGRLIAGGNTKVIRCWDVTAEKCQNTFESKSDASLTALTTAWDYDCSIGYSGLGPDMVVAGYGNGSLRIFDSRSRTDDSALYLSEGLGGHQGLLSRRRKFSEFDEHTSWIVDVSFTTYGGRHEIVTGCVSGSIKFWDLRYSSSIRTIDHKMQMTALSAHSNIPMFATGSPTQFIKMMTYDGTTQQVIRYHEKCKGQRVGPVSCLSFHPHMPFLAAGFADDLVSLYAPKESHIMAPNDRKVT